MDGGTEGRGSKDIRPIAECRLTIENWATSLSSSFSFNSDDGGGRRRDRLQEGSASCPIRNTMYVKEGWIDGRSVGGCASQLRHTLGGCSRVAKSMCKLNDERWHSELA